MTTASLSDIGTRVSRLWRGVKRHSPPPHPLLPSPRRVPSYPPPPSSAGARPPAAPTCFVFAAFGVTAPHADAVVAWAPPPPQRRPPGGNLSLGGGERARRAATTLPPPRLRLARRYGAPRKDCKRSSGLGDGDAVGGCAGVPSFSNAVAATAVPAPPVGGTAAATPVGRCAAAAGRRRPPAVGATPQPPPP